MLRSSRPVILISLGVAAVALVAFLFLRTDDAGRIERRTGDPAIDTIIESLLHDDAEALATRFQAVPATEGIFYVGGVGRPNTPGISWTSSLAAAERSLYAVFHARPEEDETRPWSLDIPFTRSLCALRRDPLVSLPECAGDRDSDVYIVLAVAIAGEEYGWRFAVREGRVAHVAIPARGAPKELRHPSSFIPRLAGDEERYLVFPPDGPTREEVESFTLEEASGALVFLSDASGTVPPGQGVYFVDIATGAVEGWHLPAEERFLGEYAISGDNRIVSVSLRRGTVVERLMLADRGTRSVYGWTGDAELVRSAGDEVASAGGHVLFRFPGRFPNPIEEEWFAVVDLDARPPVVVATFQAKVPAGTARSLRGLLSADGTKAALFEDGLSIADLATGEVHRLADGLDEPLDLEGAIRLQNSLGGTAFLLTLSPAKPGYEGYWVHHTWEGDRLAEGGGAHGVYPSPAGDVLATARPLVPGPARDISPWYVLEAVSTYDGSPLFRVVGVSTFEWNIVGNRWLADGSGIAVRDASLFPWLAMHDGSFRPYPGVPSPQSPPVFALASPAAMSVVVIDETGRQILRLSPPGGVRSFVSPWGATGAEVRFVTPHLGHGGFSGPASLVRAYVERPPYEDLPWLQLSDEARAAELRDAPTGKVTGRLSDNLRVLAHETELRETRPGTPGHDDHCRLLARLAGAQPTCPSPLYGKWVRVTTEDGSQGWLLVEVATPGI